MTAHTSASATDRGTAAVPPAGPDAALAAAPAAPPQTPKLTRQQKAAVILGVLGPDAAAPILEKLDEASLRGFAEGMAQIRRIEPPAIGAAVREFLSELLAEQPPIRGGLQVARSMLEAHVDEATLMRILDDVDVPSVTNVWRKLGRVNEDALADFLKREHPQTAAVVLSKLSSDIAARILSRFEPNRAKDVVLGINKTQSLDPKVIEAIGSSVSRDFLAGQNADAPRRDPAERVGAIMNVTAADIRNHVLDSIAETNPEFAEEIKRKMFTFEDIPARIEARDVPAILRAMDRDTQMRALGHALEAMPQAAEFVLKSVSSRMAEQMRSDLKDLGKVHRKDGEEAQNEMITAIRGMVERGEIRLVVSDEES